MGQLYTHTHLILGAQKLELLRVAFPQPLAQLQRLRVPHLGQLPLVAAAGKDRAHLQAAPAVSTTYTAGKTAVFL